MQSQFALDSHEEFAGKAAHTNLRSLVVVARHHGLHLSVEQFLRDYAVGENEVGPRLLAKIAQENGLKARAVKLRWKNLANMGKALPVLLRMRDGRAMVMIAFNEDDGGTPVVTLQDPLSKEGACISVDEVRLASVWGGEAVLFKRLYAMSDSERPFGLMWLLHQIGKEWRIFRDIAVAALMLSFLVLVPPLLFMIILDRVMVHQRMSTLSLIVGGAALLLVFDTAFGYLRRYLVAMATARIDARIGLFIFDRMINLPIEFFEKTAAGVVNYQLNEVWRIRNFLTGPLFTVMLDTMTLVILIPFMFFISAPLTFYVLGITFLMFLVVLGYIGPLARAYGHVVRAEQRKGSFMIEVLHGIRTVKSLALEGRKRQEWDIRVAEAVRATTAMGLLANHPQTLLQPLEKMVYIGTLALGAYLAIGDDATVQAGAIVAFSMISQRAVSPLVQLAGIIQQVQEISGAVSQVAAVVNQEPERPAGVRGVRPEIKGEISFTDVRFRYPGAQNYALNNISFKIEKGSVVGVMGRSGSGKTTITRLLQGLHPIYDGLIKIDGVDLKEIDLSHLRSNLGVVLQDNFLFQGTIRENIMATRQSASLEEVIHATRMAGAEEFIERLPRGYDTYLEEGSTNLSGGQRQRIAIARALLVDPSVLILDEATSALDPDSEAIINNNLNRIGQGRTMIIISHRLASLVNCDQILVLERGELYDAGKHDALLNRCDVYRHLWFQQNRHLAPGSSHDRTSIASTVNH